MDSIYSTVRTSQQIVECTQAALPNNSKNDATKNCFTNDYGVKNEELFRIMQKYKDFFLFYKCQHFYILSLFGLNKSLVESCCFKNVFYCVPHYD